MSKRIIMPALLAACLAGSGAALAQDHDSSWQRDSDRLQDRHDVDRGMSDRRDADTSAEQRDSYRHDADRRDDRDHDRYRRDADRRDDRSEGGYGHTGSFSAGYDGAGPFHDLHRGDSLPSRYRTRQYVIDNYRMHHLAAPPRGYRWVQTGADYVLVDEASGTISRIEVGR